MAPPRFTMPVSGGSDGMPILSSPSLGAERHVPERLAGLEADGGQRAERRRGTGRTPARQPDLPLHDVGRALHVGEFLADALAAGQLLAHHLPCLARNQRDHRGQPVVRHDGDAAIAS